MNRRLALIASAALFWIVVEEGCGVALAEQRPQFADYPATEVLDGPPHDPVLRSAVVKEYRTRIRKAISAGDGLLGSESQIMAAQRERPPRPNFAGVFYAVTWGCGSDGCAALAVIDGRTGEVFGPPPDSQPQEGFVLGSYLKAIHAKPDSRLIAIEHVEWLDQARLHEVCVSTYYDWQRLRYQFVRRIAIPCK